MRLLVVLLLLTGCATDDGAVQPGSFHTRMDGVYTTFGSVGLSR